MMVTMMVKGKTEGEDMLTIVEGKENITREEDIDKEDETAFVENLLRFRFTQQSKIDKSPIMCNLTNQTLTMLQCAYIKKNNFTKHLLRKQKISLIKFSMFLACRFDNIKLN